MEKFLQSTLKQQKNRKMQLSVVILNYNVAPFLALCISSVQRAIEHINAEIIVVDNASSDDSLAMMRDKFPEIQLIANAENAGFPKGNNIGVAQAQGKYVCILNPDTVVAEDTFSRILDFVSQQSSFGILGCHLIDGAGHFLPESKRGVPTPWVAFTKVLGLYRMFPHQKKFNRYYAQHIAEHETGKVDILVGAFMVLTKELYQKVGGFDEGCFMYSDDIDLSYLSLLAHKNNWYFPETTVIHFKGESTLKDGTYMKRFQEAMQFFYGKHFKKSRIFNLFMQVGIGLFALKKKTEKGQVRPEPHHFFLVTANDELFAQWKKKYPKLQPCSPKEVLQKCSEMKEDCVEWWFDIEGYSYKDYISFIKRQAGSQMTFKIKPSNFDFFIGSNDKNDRGEVVFL